MNNFGIDINNNKWWEYTLPNPIKYGIKIHNRKRFDLEIQKIHNKYFEEYLWNLDDDEYIVIEFLIKTTKKGGESHISLIESQLLRMIEYKKEAISDFRYLFTHSGVRKEIITHVYIKSAIFHMTSWINN